MLLPHIEHRFVDVDGIRVFYRETGPKDAPTMLLLHGFPSSSHQFRRLFDALGTRFHLIAPDYPGFGQTDAPSDFVATFDRLADVIEGFCEQLELRSFVLYAFDFGGPVGFRLAVRHPAWITGLVVQNANAYDEGLSPMARELASTTPATPDAESKVRPVLTFDVTRQQYLGGTSHPERVAPDGYVLDQHYLDRPRRDRVQIALALDYHTNVARYPEWQAWLRTSKPRTLVLWGGNDAFFPREGALAYARDLPDAAIHVFETGHFALEECAPEIAPLIAEFLEASDRE